jgi:threonine/homoserine/homoserine lactone efflux protein
MSAMEWFTLAALCLTGAASPGPSLAVVFSAAVSSGRQAGLLASWAHALGVGLYAALTVYGLSIVLTARPWLFLSIQLAGAAYLLYLAQKLWRSSAQAARPANTREQSQEQAQEWSLSNQQPLVAAMRDGFAVAFLNPKLAVFMLALFSQFIRPGASEGLNLILITTALAVDGLWYSLVTVLVTRPGWVEHLRRNGARIDRIFAVMLTALAITIAARALWAQ